MNFINLLSIECIKYNAIYIYYIIVLINNVINNNLNMYPKFCNY